MSKRKDRLVCGIGVNDADYPVTRKILDLETGDELIWNCPFYLRWVGMLNRCYGKSVAEIRPSYLESSVCEEWLRFSNFKLWMEKQDWENKELDKDLLVYGNKIYSPQTCVFVDRAINIFIVDSTKTRGIYPLGVSVHRNKYQAQYRVNGKQTYIGTYETPEAAHEAWLKAKLEQAKVLASSQKDDRVASALIDRYEIYIK